MTTVLQSSLQDFLENNLSTLITYYKFVGTKSKFLQTESFFRECQMNGIDKMKQFRLLGSSFSSGTDWTA